MMKRKYLIYLVLIGFISYGLFSCTNENENSVKSNAGLTIEADFLKLADNGTDIAGALSIVSDSKDIQLIWNTDSICNLDTSLTSISSQNGKYILPIKWQKHLSDSTFAPEGVAYKAGVKIIAGEYSKYVPLIWAEQIDTTKVLESIRPVTRGANDDLPRIIQITMVPSTVNMNSINGGSMYIGLSEIPFVVFDLSELTSDMNIDMSKLPNHITESQFLDFKWNTLGAPSYGFSANIIAMSEGLTQIGTITYSPSTPPQPVQYTVNFSAGPGGSVTPTSATGTNGTQVSSTATANSGNTFIGWYKNNGTTAISTNKTISIILSESENGNTYTAKFKSIPPIGPIADGWTGQYIWVKSSLVSQAPSQNDICRLLGTPNSIYWDSDGGPEWRTTLTSGRNGAWVLKRAYWGTRQVTETTIGVANDEIRTNGKYVFLPAAGMLQQMAYPYNLYMKNSCVYWSRDVYNNTSGITYQGLLVINSNKAWWGTSYPVYCPACKPPINQTNTQQFSTFIRL